MEIVDQFDYDGIDLDWEYPDTKEEVVGFERLTRRFRKELDALGKKKGRPMVVTMAASSNPGTLKWLDKAFLLETMDWINVMTYDFTGDWTELRRPPLAALRLVEAAGGSSPFDGIDHEVPARGAGTARRTGWRWGSRSTAAASTSPSRMPRPRARRRRGSRGAITATSTSSRTSPDWTREVGRRDQEPLADLARRSRW